MDLSDILDLIFTGEEELRNLGSAGGPEARKLVDEAVAATKKAREEAERAFGRVFERAGLVKRADVSALTARVELLEKKLDEILRLLSGRPLPPT